MIPASADHQAKWQQPALLAAVVVGAALLAGCDGATGPGRAGICQAPAPRPLPAQFSTPNAGPWQAPTAVPVQGQVRDVLADGGDLLLAAVQSEEERSSVMIARWSTGSWAPGPEWLRTEKHPVDMSLLQAAGGPALLWTQEDSAPTFPTPRPGGEFPNALYVMASAGAGPRLVWEAAGTISIQRATSDAEAGIHMTLSIREGYRPQLAYLGGQPGSWNEPESIGPGFSGYVVVGPDGDLWVAYIGAEPPPDAGPGSSGINPVFLRRSPDGGCTWGPVSAVHVGQLGAYAPALVFDASHRPHVVWLQDVDGDKYPDEIWWTRSEDGSSWAPPQPISGHISGTPVGLQLVADGGGGVHVVANVLATPFQYPLRPFYFMWDGDEWSSPEHLFGLTDASAQMALSEDGTLHLVVNSLSQGILHSMKER